jgi:hypothetical protein
MSKNIFDWLNEITLNKIPWEKFTQEDKQSWNTYMIRRFISMDKNYTDLVSEIQNYPIPVENEYKFWCRVLPKRKTFFRYIKPQTNLPSKELLSILATYFKVSQREIIDNFNLLDKNILKDILQELGIQDKQIKTLLK